MRRQEGVEVDEDLTVEAGVVKFRIGQLCVVAKRLPVAVEKMAECRLPRRGLGQ